MTFKRKKDVRIKGNLPFFLNFSLSPHFGKVYYLTPHNLDSVMISNCSITSKRERRIYSFITQKNFKKLQMYKDTLKL